MNWGDGLPRLAARIVTAVAAAASVPVSSTSINALWITELMLSA